MILAMRYRTKVVWHLREIEDKVAEQYSDFVNVPDFHTAKIAYPCGTTFTRNKLDNKIFVAKENFHKLDKKGLCKRCAKRLKDYAKYQILHAAFKAQAPIKQFWIYSTNGLTYNSSLNTFNRDFYNNLRYVQYFL